jgi:hypothetical protein
MWAPKMSTKGHTGDQRTKDKGRTNLSSLSLSFVSRMHPFTVLLPGRKEDTESPVRRRRGESSLLRVSLGMCALEMVVLFHQSARARRRKRASAKKEEKQTNEQRTEAQKISKKCQRGIFQRAKRGRLLGDWRRLFTKK